MILHMIGCLLLLQLARSASILNPRALRIPDIDVSPPEEVNNLGSKQVVARSIDSNHNNAKNNIEDTIREVEEILRSNPKLPRLTRGEILDFVENITKSDNEKKRDPKAIMVVMPYTPPSNIDDQNMAELFTKPPVTHIIGAEPFKVQKNATTSRRRPTVKFNAKVNSIEKNEEVKSTTPRISHRRRRLNTTIATTYHPPTLRPRQEPVSTYHPSRRPIRRRTTTTQYPNHRYTEEEVSTKAPSFGGGFRIIQPPKLSPSELNGEESITHEVFLKEKRTKVPFNDIIKQEVIVKQEVPVAASQVTTTIEPLLDGFVLPEHLKKVLKDLDVEEAMNAKPQEDLPSVEEQKRIKQMLASIGILPEGTVATTTTTTSMPNAEMIADSLTPEMQHLLKSFGLLPNPNDTVTEEKQQLYNPEKAETKPEEYVGFKPLPDNGPGRQDMDALLASFGLGRSARKEKSVKTEDYSFDMIPDNLKQVIAELGINQTKRQEKKISSSSITKVVDKQHVFNPDNQYATDEELKKLDKLLGMIKQLEKLNGTATDEDLKKIDVESLKDLVGSLNNFEQNYKGPDPNTFDVSSSKKEVKRQETTTTEKASTTEEPRNPSLSDLEASFGGTPETATLAVLPEPTTKRNGFYYLVDWNTFFDIDDTKGRRVNLRFQPTIGDPKRFLSVNVP